MAQHICTTCGKGFSRPAQLREHMQRVHEGVRYQCSRCHKHFCMKAYRDQHQQQCSGTVFTCMECGQEFEQALQLQTHQHTAHQRQSTHGNRRQCHDETAQTSAEGRGTIAKWARSEHQQIDPLQPEPDMLPSGDDDLSVSVRNVYQEHWSAIQTHYRVNQCIQDVYYYRIRDININSLMEQLQEMFRNQTN